TWGSRGGGSLGGRNLPARVLAPAKDSVGGALQAATAVGGEAGQAIASAARSAFIDGFHVALLAGSLATLVGLVVTILWLPAHARERDRTFQQAEFVSEHPELEPHPAP